MKKKPEMIGVLIRMFPNEKKALSKIVRKQKTSYRKAVLGWAGVPVDN